MGMATKAIEQFAARFQRFQKMEVVDGSSGAMRLFSVAREHQRRSAITFDNASGSNSDHSAVQMSPSMTMQYASRNSGAAATCSSISLRI